MKKLVMFFGFLLIIGYSFGQATAVGEFRVADSTVLFGVNLPIGTKIYDIQANQYWVLTAGAASTKKLSTATKSSLTGLSAANLSWDAANGHINIDTGTDADVGGFGTANTNYGFVVGSNNATTSFLRGDNTWQPVITTEVDGSISNEGKLTAEDASSTTAKIRSNTSTGKAIVINAATGLGINTTDSTIFLTTVDQTISNEGKLTVGAGGANDSKIVSNTSTGKAVVIAGGTGITISEADSTITITSSITQSTTSSTEYFEVAANDLIVPYPITLAHTPASTSTISVQINGIAVKYTAGTTNWTFNFSGTTLSVYVPVYQYDQVLVSYHY